MMFFLSYAIHILCGACEQVLSPHNRAGHARPELRPRQGSLAAGRPEYLAGRYASAGKQKNRWMERNPSRAPPWPAAAVAKAAFKPH